jgi:8-oxo-dGTP pyrophosphatase MutT (NUDIX family)
MTKEYTHAGGVVVRRDDRKDLFLLVTASGHKDEWVLPKGHIDGTETPEEAAVREVEEESGVRARVVDVAGESDYKSADEDVRAIFYVMEYEGESDAEEDRKIRWSSLEDGLPLLSFEESRRIVRRALERAVKKES